MIDASMTLANIVTRHPEVARELESRGLDYCCGGGRSLEEACTASGLDPTATAIELAAHISSAAAPAWAGLGPDELADHIETTHHAYLWTEMPRVSALLDKISAVHGERHPELSEVAATWGEIRADLEPHMMREERVLFPMIRELASARTAPRFRCGSLRNPISVMLREHDSVGELFSRLRQITDNYRVPDDGCASYTACYRALEELEADTHLHIHKENNVLFPVVERLEDELNRRAAV